ncbi:hypothetical protein AeRB84_001868 [Aphanomyces euteiches]|nr:hypothetical protein AeRB84_001868 [Aphanomyces euteiches]
MEFSNVSIKLIVNGTTMEYSWNEFTLALGNDFANQSLSLSRQVLVTLDAIDALWIVFCAMQIMLVQVGYYYLASAVSLSESKSLAVSTLAVVLSYTITFALSFGHGTGIFGSDGFFLIGSHSNVLAFWLLQAVIQMTMTTLVVLSLGCRVAKSVLWFYVLVVNVIVYPAIVHAVWSSTGWASRASALPSILFNTPVLDFGGCSVIHICAGVAVFIASLLSREPLYTEKPLSPVAEPSPDSSFRHAFGTWMIFVGWFGLIQASTNTLEGPCVNVALSSCVNLVTSSVAASFTSCVVAYFIPVRFPINHGFLSGMVAISAAASTASVASAVVIGIVAGAIFVGASSFSRWLRLDDALEIVSVHLFNAVWGLMAAGACAATERVVEASQCNAAHIYQTLPSNVKTCALWEGCSEVGNQLGSNIVFALMSLVFTALVCGITGGFLHWQGWFVEWQPMATHDLGEDLYPTDDDVVPWRDVESPKQSSHHEWADVDIQSSVERRYQFTPQSWHSWRQSGNGRTSLPEFY